MNITILRATIERIRRPTRTRIFSRSPTTLPARSPPVGVFRSRPVSLAGVNTAITKIILFQNVACRLLFTACVSIVLLEPNGRAVCRDQLPHRGGGEIWPRDGGAQSFGCPCGMRSFEARSIGS